MQVCVWVCEVILYVIMLRNTNWSIGLLIHSGRGLANVATPLWRVQLILRKDNQYYQCCSVLICMQHIVSQGHHCGSAGTRYGWCIWIVCAHAW